MNAGIATKRRSMAAFVRERRVRIESKLVGKRRDEKDIDTSQWPPGSAHWKVVLRCGSRRMTLYFSQGPAVCKEPEASEVLSCLALDAGSVENTGSDFEAWCSEYGYDTDSRKAERTYKLCKEQTTKLSKLLGEAAYHELLWNTESD